jgi:hypothetical protein
MQVWLNIESYVFFNLLSKFEEKSHNIADPYNFSYFYCINQGSTETNQQQPTDIKQKITNAHEQHKLPNNLK